MHFIVPDKDTFHIGEVTIRTPEGGGRFVTINRDFANEPVNLDFVIYFTKTLQNFHTGEFKIPQILFVTAVRDNNMVWSFETEEERDDHYSRLLNLRTQF